MKRVALGAAVAALLGVVALSPPSVAADPPQFQVDPFWPKPLPNNWLFGQIGGLAVDSNDHLWVLQRPRSLTEDERGATLKPPRNNCCIPAPSVLEFDADGKLLSKARETVFHNGVLVQNNVELTGPTGWIGRIPYRAHPERMPIAFQDHGNPVAYRHLMIKVLPN